MSVQVSSWRPTQFLSLLDLTPAELESCLALAASLKTARRANRPHATPLAGRHVALLFDKPSLRTRSTFTYGSASLPITNTRSALKRKLTCPPWTGKPPAYCLKPIERISPSL